MYKGEYSQKHLEESRAERESGGMASILNQVMRERLRERESQEGTCMTEVAGFYRCESLGEGKPLDWRSLGY